MLFPDFSLTFSFSRTFSLTVATQVFGHKGPAYELFK